MEESMVIWEGARGKLAEALGEETSLAAVNAMSQLAVAAQVAAETLSSADSPAADS